MMFEDPEWNDKRVALTNAVIRAAIELSLFSGACRMEIPGDGIKVVIEVSRKVQ